MESLEPTSNHISRGKDSRIRRELLTACAPKTTFPQDSSLHLLPSFRSEAFRLRQPAGTPHLPPSPAPPHQVPRPSRHVLPHSRRAWRRWFHLASAATSEEVEFHAVALLCATSPVRPDDLEDDVEEDWALAASCCGDVVLDRRNVVWMTAACFGLEPSERLGVAQYAARTFRVAPPEDETVFRCSEPAAQDVVATSRGCAPTLGRQ